MLLPQHSDDAPLRESSAVLPRRTAQEAPSFTPKLPLIRLENGRFRRMTAPDRTEQNVPEPVKSAGPFLSKRHANGHGITPIAYEPEGKLPRRSKLNGGDEFKVVAALKGKER